MLTTIKNYLPLTFLIFAMAACQNNSADPEFNYSKINSTTADSLKTAITTDTAVKQQVTTTSPTTVATAVKQTAAKTTSGVNPEHGQPGHRCDIAVGAPLNSKPGNVTTTTTTKQPPAQITSAPKTATPAGMNPPHGEPGHKCEIAVGAPLNSKPVTPVVADTSKK